MALSKAIKNNIYLLLVLVIPAVIITMPGCKRKHSEVADYFFKRTQNKAFKGITDEQYDSIFRKVYKEQKPFMAHSLFILNYYHKNHFRPSLVMEHLYSSDFSTLTDYYRKANRHGIDPVYFQADTIDKLVDLLKDKKGITKPDQACRAIAKLELVTASTLINYSNSLEFGLVSPKQIFSRYFTQTLRPDSVSMLKVLKVKNLPLYLDSIQPKSPQYLALQKALVGGYIAPGMSFEQTRRLILVNMERVRWKNKPTQDRYVMVNIPDYTLDVMDSGKSVLNMKVCVGEGRNKGNPNTLASFNDTCREDKPYVKETPQLNSMIHTAEVNPIWNIPQSIANKEVLVQADKDPNYFDNKNIDVYHNDKKIDPGTIDWSTAKAQDYDFKQRPGEDNSLGKIKFLFDNRSNVYLHDTPAKEAFHYKVRAVSHGCVRLEKPLDFAHTLFGDGKKYDLISKDFNEDNPEPTSIYLKPNVPVYIAYYTCWQDNDGQLQIRDDIYGLDIVLWVHMEKFVPKTQQELLSSR